jgi:hypothetical protein
MRSVLVFFPEALDPVFFATLPVSAPARAPRGLAVIQEPTLPRLASIRFPGGARRQSLNVDGRF